jgi:hypothetical protein
MNPAPPWFPTSDPGLFGSWNSGATATVVLDLANLETAAGDTVNILPLVNAKHFLDLTVHDETAVDYARLTYVSCAGGNAFPDCRGFTTSVVLFGERFSVSADSLPAPGDPIVYDSTRVYVARSSGEAFYVSGSAGGLSDWVCDDRLYVNGVYVPPVGFDGIGDPTLPECEPIENILGPVPARDITAYLPDTSGCVTFALADTQREIFGNTAIHLVRMVGVGVEASPGDLASVEIAPNPTQGSVRITLSSAAPGEWRGAIFDAGGRVVWAAPPQTLAAPGGVGWEWNGIDRQGTPSAPGVFFYLVEGPATQLKGKVVRLR